MRPSGSPKTVAASSNDTLCLARFAAAFCGSHSNSSANSQYNGACLPNRVELRKSVTNINISISHGINTSLPRQSATRLSSGIHNPGETMSKSSQAQIDEENSEFAHPGPSYQ